MAEVLPGRGCRFSNPKSLTRLSELTFLRSEDCSVAEVNLKSLGGWSRSFGILSFSISGEIGKKITAVN